ncbi:M20/M25/M40 family metallo-hydrolase [Micromonospora carbonacea]|uniref:M20/M25/M40 family metallo-hydrolase n=1 Tax=Micromonospora carbonacea TaxID=47853 RepID=A0A7H8XLC6_9ACTN|nr:M20/M25/M40 family metallo-hydrolase [Micromonospora carbonacea]MBB5826070.1 acetylornithine deacetylase/succinyl-diaminopimelate desuccinylase-like protein [Micromonospora carbonacea]QLD25645.1 M20/M25/M40 family metallo-hydrolase [Micromonospora carbonacea]
MPHPDTAAALAAVDTHFDEFVAELQQLCRIRSRRQEPDQMAATARFIADSVHRWGGQAEIIEWEQSHPYVLAEIPGAGRRRLLHFTHYDVEVEPAGDDADWISPPYAAEIHDGRLYARGVADDKGALMSRIHAVAAWRLAGLTPPVTSRFIFEGKQWLHSPGLGSFCAAHADRLASDAALWENSWRDGQDRPLLKLAEKGVLYLRLTVRTLPRDLTSQNTALLPAATARLAAALAQLQRPDGTVTVPGFADDVRPLTDAERDLLAEVEFDGDFLRERAGVRGFTGGLDDRQAAVAIRTVPTLTVAGIAGGDMRDDVTLGIPATAAAKVEIRLVPGQDPQRVLAAVRDHLAATGFGDVGIEVMATSRPNMTDHRDPFVALVADAARRAYGAEPVIEPYTQWIGNQGALAARPIVGVGVSRADSGVDGPNENIRLDDYRDGIRHVIEVMAALAVTG